MAEFTIQYDADLRLTRVDVTGDMHKSDGEKIIMTSRAAAMENQSDLLYDVRDAISKVSLGDWFFLPRRLDALQTPSARGQRVAVVASSSELADYRFYEDVARNAGLVFRVFINEKEAITWLGQAD